MRMAFQHHDDQIQHPLRSLVFAVLVVIIAMLVSAATWLQIDPAPIAASDNAVFITSSYGSTEGEEVFKRICSTCHTVDMPTDPEIEPLAPPMKMVARRYLMSLESIEDANARIIEWLKGPDAEKSLMPPMAIEHHGLMPPVVLTDEERTAVAEFVLTLADMPGAGMGNGHMQCQGMKAGMMQQRMQMKGDGQMNGCMNKDGNDQMKGCMHKDGNDQMKGCTHKEGDGQMKGCMNEDGSCQMKGCKHNADTTGDT